MKSYNDFRKQILDDPTVKYEYEKLSAEYEIAEALIQARIKSKLTQADVAQRMHTSQAQVARMESGAHMPSLQSIFKYAKAVKQVININIIP